MKRALPVGMLPPLDALSLSSHNASPTGVRDVNPPARRAFDLDSIIAKTKEVERVANRARAGAGRKRPDYDQDAGPGRAFIQDDNKCPECPAEVGDWSPPYEGVRRPLNEQVSVDPDDQVKRCRRCGIEVAKFTQDAEPEKRNFADEEGVDRSQHSAVTEAAQVHLNYIPPEELGMSRDDPAVWTVNNRLQQCFVWLEKMRENPVTHVYKWWLTPPEVLRAKRLLRAVCVQWGRDGMARTPQKRQNGNPILWSIYAALQMTAERENGFAVRTVALQQLLTLDGLHTLLGHFEADIQRTDERAYNATIARGQGAAGAWLLQRQKYRKPDYDAIPVDSRRARMIYFNHLVKNTRMLWDGDVPEADAGGEPIPPDEDEYEEDETKAKGGMNPRVLVGMPPVLLPPQNFPVYN